MAFAKNDGQDQPALMRRLFLADALRSKTCLSASTGQKIKGLCDCDDEHADPGACCSQMVLFQVALHKWFNHYRWSKIIK